MFIEELGEQALEELSDNYVPCVRFELVSTDPGTLAPPSKYKIIQRTWTEGIGALVSSLGSDGYPDYNVVNDSGGTPIIASLSQNPSYGDYRDYDLSGTPSGGWTVAIVYGCFVPLDSLGEDQNILLDGSGGAGGGGGGITDHGALTGLGDDDHTQYHTDGRAVTWHSGVTHAYSSLSGLPTLGTAAAKDVPATGDATTGQVVLGSDTRLTDARTPTSHSHSHTALTDIGTNTHAVLDTFKAGIESIQSATHFVTGIGDRSLSTISLSGRLFTIAPTSTSFDIYSDGTRYSKGTCQTTIDDVVGLHYIYFDSTGTLQHSQSAWNIISANVPVATVYWNGSVGAITDERHSANRSQTWHAWAHLTVGTRYESGFAGTFATGSMRVTQGVLWDEDLRFDSGSTRTNCRLWYRASGGTAMTFEVGVSTAAKISGGNLQWDNAGTPATVGNGKYAVNWVYAANDMDYPVMVVVSQAEYNTLALARSASLPSFPNVPTAELKLIYRTIWSGTTAAFVEATDYRTSATLPAGGTTTPAASNVTFVPAGNIAATNVQAALEELDAEKATTGHNHTGTYEPANANIQSHISSTSNPHSVTASQAGAEPALGNPAASGYVLSSTDAGVRSWVAPGVIALQYNWFLR